VQNIVPTTSGASKALGKVLPKLAGKVKGYALRVPVATVSVVDFTVNLCSDASFEAVKAAIERASTGAMRGIVAVETEPTVSTDVVGNGASCVFDARASFAVSPRCHKLVAWYDNEWGYACRVVDLVEHVDRADRDKARLDALLEEKRSREAEREAGKTSAAAA
jgi:glyceraldehyde 3-phosphate dehydrogenase